MDDGFNVAIAFFGLGLLLLFIAQFLFVTIAWVRRLLG